MLLFMDGMAHYASAGIAHKYTVRDDTGVTWSIVAEGRYGNCLKRVALNTAAAGYLGVTPLTTRTGLWTPQSGGVCGFAIKVDDLAAVAGSAGGTQAKGLLVIEESGLEPIGGGDGYHLRVDLNASGTFTLRRRNSSSADVIANSLEGLTSNTWMYLEFKWLLDNTVGTFEIRVNTIPVLTYTGDTRINDTANFGVWNSVRLFHASTSAAPLLVMRFSDLYLADLAGSGADVRDFLGDGVVDTIFPNGVGLATAWTPSEATANWDLVNDQPVPDGDATYVATSAPGTRDCHHYEDIPVGATVLGVHYNMLVRKEDEGTVTVKPITGQGGVQYDGPTQGVANILYDRYLTQSYDVNPATGVAWTAAEINAGQWGILKVT